MLQSKLFHAFIVGVDNFCLVFLVRDTSIMYCVQRADAGHQRAAIDSWTMNGGSVFFPSNYSSMLTGSAAGHFSSFHARDPSMVCDVHSFCWCLF